MSGVFSKRTDPDLNGSFGDDELTEQKLFSVLQKFGLT